MSESEKAKRYFVAKGKSICTRRGVVTCESDNPEIVFDDVRVMGGGEIPREEDEFVALRLDEYVETGYLVTAEENPYVKEREDAEAAAAESREDRVAKARAARRAKAEELRRSTEAANEDDVKPQNPSVDTSGVAGDASRAGDGEAEAPPVEPGPETPEPAPQAPSVEPDVQTGAGAPESEGDTGGIRVPGGASRD